MAGPRIAAIAALWIGAIVVPDQLLADDVTINLSGVPTGSHTLITAPGGSFAQTFVGQTVAGVGISGTPTSPLTLKPGGTLTLSLFNGFNTILPQPSNTAPLSILLDQSADSLTWWMGHASAGATIDMDFFAQNGALVHTVQITLLSAYNKYTLTGLPIFSGVTFYNNNDPGGLRFYDFHYNSTQGKTYGSGCPGSGNFTPTLGVGGPPVAGAQLSIEIADGLGGATAYLFFGLSQAALPMGDGCTLNVTPLFPLIITLPLGGSGPGAGTATLAGLLPAGTTGLTFTSQVFVLDAGTSLGFCNSQGLEITIL